MRPILAVIVAAGCMGALPALAEIVPRNSPASGSVIARKLGEEVRFIDVSQWRSVDIRQDLLAGDLVRTNAQGSLAILFADRTQMRLGRNTTLLVKAVGSAADSAFTLQSGTLWGRAERGGLGLTVETAAATAAVRGTDFTLSVDASGRTSLIVLEGTVELFNEFGSVSVAEGEAAAASIGSAPTKIVIVDPVDREQMLFHLSLRTAFGSLPAAAMPASGIRSERTRIAAIPPPARSAEERVVFAETALSHDGREAARMAVAAARGVRLSRSQAARVYLVDALIAGADGRYAEAAALFAKARGHLTGGKRAIADYGGYFARSLANPDRVESPPSADDGGPYGIVAGAWTTGFLQDIPSALAVVKAGEGRYPDNPTLPALRAQLALLIDDRDQAEEAIDRALQLDPDDANALEARANFRAGFKADLKGAQADLERAIEFMPGSSSLWNALGLVLSGRGATREAENALKRAIALDPEDPVSHANLAILYLDEDRLDEAKAEIDRALEVDPSFDIALVARGRYHLQTGELDKAQEDLLAGTTANPGYAQGVLLLAGSYYESGDREPAAQAIENAERLDPNDPVTASFRTAVAIDDYDADGAIRAAQEALARTQARGGDFAALSANKDAGSTLNNAYRLAGLDAWGRYYGDAVFDPFAASGYVDRTVAGSPDPFVTRTRFGASPTEPTVNSGGFSSFIQALALEPAMISGRSRSANLFRRPFVEGSLGGGFVASDGGMGWTGEAEVQGYVNEPVPWSFYGRVEGRAVDEFRRGFTAGVPVPTTTFTLEEEVLAGTGYITARPTPDDRLVAYVDVRRQQDGIDDAVVVPAAPIIVPPLPPIIGFTYDREVEDRTGVGGLVWSHSFGYRNVGNLAVFGTDVTRTSTETGAIVFDFGGIPIAAARTVDAQTELQSFLVAANHLYGTDDLTLRYGAEGGQVAYRQVSTDSMFLGGPPVVTTDAADAEFTVARGYLDVLWEATPTLQFEGGIFPVRLDGTFERTRLDPRVGAAWTPVEGHWLRAGYLSETVTGSAASLAPVGVLGLQSNQMPIFPGGRVDTLAARWDAEWSSRFFTSVDYQYQEGRDLSIPVPGSLDTYDIASGRIDRVSATANLWLGGGFSTAATIAYAQSEDRDPASVGFGGPLPFVPDWSGRVGVTWVHPSNVKVTLAATYVGERAGDQARTRLDDHWTADTFLTWEPFDKRFSLELAAYNLFDESFEIAPMFPGWGRTFTGTFKVRF